MVDAKTPGEIVDTLRKRHNVLVVDVGPLIGKSSTWGQRILDGSICPTLSNADCLARELCAQEEERLSLLEAVGRVKFARAGITGDVLEEILGILEQIYKEVSL